MDAVSSMVLEAVPPALGAKPKAFSYENPVTIGFHPETHEPYLFAYNDRRDRTFFTHFGEDMEDSYIPMVTHEYGAYQYRDFVNKRVYRARELARQARFEYGETPRIRRSYR